MPKNREKNKTKKKEKKTKKQNKATKKTGDKTKTQTTQTKERWDGLPKMKKGEGPSQWLSTMWTSVQILR